jgi:hypothetical protein
MALRTSHFAIIGLSILLALFFASYQKQGVVNIEDSLFEELNTPALELLQRSAKVTQVSSSKHAAILEDTSKPIKLWDALLESGEHIRGPADGVSANGVGNLKVFITGVITDAIVCIVCLCLFMTWSKQHPIMYKDNVLKGIAPEVPEGLFGFAKASWNLDIDQAWNSAGLDHAMLLEFVNLCLNMFKWIAFPMFFIMGPMNCAFGGNAAGQDHESWFSMGNVKYYIWLYYPISVMICYVTWCVTSMCHTGMRKFMPLRFEWLRAMETTRANTIMMVGIPPEYQSDQACKAFWDTLLPGGRVESVNLVKDTSSEGNLVALVAERDATKHHLELAQATWAAEDKDPDKRPTIKTSYFGSRVDAIDTYTKQIEDLHPRIKESKDNIYKKASNVGYPNLSAGFISFKDRKDAEIALRLDLADDSNVWVLDYPPQPADVIWVDLTQDPRAEGGRKLLGYAITVGLVIIYMPLVVFICNVAEMINLGPLQPIWSSEAPSLGLTIMVDFLPTILNMIFVNCFSLYDKTQSQFKLSVWYWWMNLLYVVMITALGTNFMSFVETLSKDPLKIFSLLADTMPECTHYYMNYICMQTYTHAMVLTRYVPYIKYRNALRSRGEQEAKDMAEPEDQEYYGIGSRTARWSTMMCIGVVYGTLSPPVSLLSFFLFGWIRLVYGYLFVYAESKKSDLGGIFFVQAIRNTYTTLHVYMILMVGVFFQRAPNYYPIILICCAWAYVFHSQKKFNEYKWERLPFPELTSGTKVTHKIQEIKGNYVQPELND